MSINAMSAVASSPPKVVADEGLNQANYLKAVTTYIPSEAIALYLFVLGLLTGSGSSGDDLNILRWVAFGIGVVTAAGLVLLTFTPGADDTAKGGHVLRKRSLLVGFAAVGFLVYSMATPGGPWGWTILGVSSAIWGSLAVAVCAVFMPILADKWGIRPKS